MFYLKVNDVKPQIGLKVSVSLNSAHTPLMVGGGVEWYFSSETFLS